jgi:hypothetical protein
MSRPVETAVHVVVVFISLKLQECLIEYAEAQEKEIELPNLKRRFVSFWI